MADGNAQEVELKLEAAAADLESIVQALKDAGFTLKKQDQQAIYFDTPGADLRAAGVSLRIRTVRGKRIQTVKAQGSAAAGLFARPEWEIAVPDDTPVLDDSAAPLRALLPAAALAALAPAFSVRVSRRSGVATCGEARIEAAVDQGEVSAGGAATPVAEVELELLSGPQDALFALARKLGEAASIRLGVLTKAERGHRLLDETTDAVVKTERAAIASDASVADAFGAIVSACLRQFRLNEDLLGRTGSADALHQARVAVRRLRSAMSIFKALVADSRFDHLRAELRWLAATLGEARDVDVLIERGENGPTLADARTAAYARVSEALASSRTRGLMLDLVEWAAIGPWRTAPIDAAALEQPAMHFAAGALERSQRRLKKRGRRLATLDDDARHQVRIDAKTLRYAAEFFADLFAGAKAQRRARRFIAAMQDLQQHLGDLNDMATEPVLRARLGLPERSSPRKRHRMRLIEKAAEAFEELIDLKPFWR
ncbi:CHAD domain-containing protein [Sphingomonas sp.]|uniref:CYTH and CHAD domain-containing protein n=1 Tax=Sphingomonas sp. TaxID=28214 RepID=UPI0035BBCFF5